MASVLPRLRSGIPGLDPVLGGGYPICRSILVSGGAGSGKTSVGVQFLDAGLREGQRGLLVSLGEHTSQILNDARQRGIDLSGVETLDLNPTADYFTAQRTYDIFSPAEVERGPITSSLTEAVTHVRPVRVFIDSLEQFRYLSPDPFQLRRHLLALMRFLTEHEATLVFGAEGSEHEKDNGLAFLADGVLDLGQDDHGRTLTVRKLRGSGFAQGRHSIVLDHEGLAVLPRVLPAPSPARAPRPKLTTGIPTLDAMIGGGLESGTITLLSGPSGTGKSTLAMTFALHQASLGKNTLLCTFEEALGITRERSLSMRLPYDEAMTRGHFQAIHIHPQRTSLVGFQELLADTIDRNRSTLVVLDSLMGLMLMGEPDTIVRATFSTVSSLQQRGLTIVLTHEQEEPEAGQLPRPSLGFLCDTILYLRFLERHDKGRLEVGRGIGVLKKRLSGFDPSLRELALGPHAIRIGPSLGAPADFVDGYAPPKPRAEGAG